MVIYIWVKIRMTLCVILALWIKVSILTFLLILLITIILLVLTLYDLIYVELNGTRIIVLILIILTLTIFLLNTKNINHLHIKGKKCCSQSSGIKTKENVGCNKFGFQHSLITSNFDYKGITIPLTGISIINLKNTSQKKKNSTNMINNIERNNNCIKQLLAFLLFFYSQVFLNDSYQH